jgi:hypothetical protein
LADNLLIVSIRHFKRDGGRLAAAGNACSARAKRIAALEAAGQLIISLQLKCADPVILAAARRNQAATAAAVAAATA